MKNTELYDMNLGDIIRCDDTDSKGYEILRVPGGWIYTKVITNRSGSQISTTFVPFSHEDW